MSNNHNHAKLTLTLLRVHGQAVNPVTWTTTGGSQVIGLDHPLFAPYDAKDIFVGEKHIELLYKDNHWCLKNIHNTYSCSLDGQKISPNKDYPLRNNNIIELGLCQIHVSDHQYLNDTDELKKLLLLDDLTSTGLVEEGIELTDPSTGAIHHIGQAHLEDKTTFEDMGLGTHFDEQAFFREVQSDSSRLSALKAGNQGKPNETLDILDQLAIESELAIINPSLLSKNADYWRGQTRQDFVNSQPIPELEHLFATEDYSRERMLPLDNLNYINKLLASNPKIDQVMPDLADVESYALFDSETGTEPLRLFSLEHQGLRAHLPQGTPEFTQREHHASSMDGHFAIPSERKQPKLASAPMPSAQVTTAKDDWLNNFSAALGDKVSSDDILNSLSITPPKVVAEVAEIEPEAKGLLNSASQTINKAANIIQTPLKTSSKLTKNQEDA